MVALHNEGLSTLDGNAQRLARSNASCTGGKLIVYFGGNLCKRRAFRASVHWHISCMGVLANDRSRVDKLL